MKIFDSVKEKIANTTIVDETVKIVDYDKEKAQTETDQTKKIDYSTITTEDLEEGSAASELMKTVGLVAEDPSEKVDDKPSSFGFNLPKIDLLSKLKLPSVSMSSKKPSTKPTKTPTGTQKRKRDKSKDILDELEIPETFTVPNEFFMPEDLRTVTFSFQTPQGFAIKEVEQFYNQTLKSLAFYVKLLTRRNEDVAKLATEIDRLQVAINNLRYEQEISHGINIMPTVEDGDLETELFEAKLAIVQLKEQLSAAGAPPELNDAERIELKDLRNINRALQREKESLTEELTKMRLRAIEDEDARTDSTPHPPTPTIDFGELPDVTAPTPHLSLPALNPPKQKTHIEPIPLNEIIGPKQSPPGSNSRILGLVYDDEEDEYGIEEIMNKYRQV